VLALFTFAVLVSVVKFAELKILVIVVDVDVLIVGHEPVKKYRAKLIERGLAHKRRTLAPK
jgi:hypothetical protein